MRISAIAAVLCLSATMVAAEPAPMSKPVPRATPEEQATALDVMDGRINTMTARVTGTLTSLHDNLMSCNKSLQTLDNDLAAGKSEADVLKGFVAALTKERDDLKAQLAAKP